MDLKTLVITHEDYGTKAVSVDGASSALDLRERVKVAFQVLGEIELFVHPCPLRSRVLDSDALPVEEPAHAAFFVALGLSLIHISERAGKADRATSRMPSSA